MSRAREDETASFSVGVLVTKLKLATAEEVASAVDYQRSASEGQMIGEILVARGLVTREQLGLVLELQEKLKSRNRGVRAMAAADLADMTRGKVVSLAESLRRRAAETRRATGEGHRAVTPAMLKEKP